MRQCIDPLFWLRAHKCIRAPSSYICNLHHVHIRVYMCYVYVCVCVCVCVHTHMLCAMYLYVCAHMQHNMFKVNSPHSRFLFVNCMLACARAFVHMDLSASVESLLANSWSVQSNRCRLWGKRVRCLLVLISLPTARHVLKACINTRECTHAYTFAFKSTNRTLVLLTQANIKENDAN